MGEGTLKGRRGERGEEGGVEHKGHDHLDEGTTRRDRTRQSRCQPALQVSQRSSVSSSKGLLQTWQCVSSKRAERGISEGDGGKGTEGKWDWRKWA